MKIQVRRETKVNKIQLVKTKETYISSQIKIQIKKPLKRPKSFKIKSYNESYLMTTTSQTLF